MLRVWILLLCLLASASVSAGEARIIKVLPHLIDAQGRNSLSPSLFERDAYQLHLRDHPEEVAGLRFDVQLKAKRSSEPLKLRLEIRGSNLGMAEVRTFETSVEPKRWFSTWAGIILGPKVQEEIGSVIAWRATLWDGTEMVAELDSFLW